MKASSTFEPILVVDDELDLRRAFVTLLEEEGYAAVEVNSAEAALYYLAQHPNTPLVFLDVMMPKMNGYQFMEELSKRPLLRTIPVVAITAGRHISLKDFSYAPVALLPKPMRLQAVLDLLFKYTGLTCNDVGAISSPHPDPQKTTTPSESQADVFFIDDEQDLISFYAEVLKESGYRVVAAFSCADALASLKAMVPPKVIFLDCSMPSMSGEKFLDILEIELPEVVKQSRIVGFSCHRSDEPSLSAFKQRLSGFEQKPLGVDDILGIYRKYADDGLTRKSLRPL